MPGRSALGSPVPPMKTTRRAFLRTAVAAATASALGQSLSGREPEGKKPSKEELDRILNAPVLTTDFLKEPVRVASMELLQNGKNYLVRTRSAEGVEVVTVPNPQRMAQTWPIFL